MHLDRCLHVRYLHSRNALMLPLQYAPHMGHTLTTVLRPSPQVSQCQKKSSSDLYGAREDNRSRHTDHPAGCHSIRDPPPSFPIFTPDALPAATLPLCSDMGQVPNMLACIPSGVVAYPSMSLIMVTICGVN